MVRGTVEETLNAMLDAETDELCNAQRYEHSQDRVDTRAGHYRRKLHTKSGEVEVKMPKLRQQTFDSVIIERYRRRNISIEEAIVQMYLAGVSVRRVEDYKTEKWCRWPESNRHAFWALPPQDSVSTNSTTSARFGNSLCYSGMDGIFNSGTSTGILSGLT